MKVTFKITGEKPKGLEISVYNKEGGDVLVTFPVKKKTEVIEIEGRKRINNAFIVASVGDADVYFDTQFMKDGTEIIVDIKSDEEVFEGVKPEPKEEAKKEAKEEMVFEELPKKKRECVLKKSIFDPIWRNIKAFFKWFF